VKARGKEIYIIAGVLAAVVCAAWYFLFFSPTRTKINDLGNQVTQAQQTLSGTKQDLVRLQAYAKAAPQTKADVVRLSKVLPSALNGMPSAIIELNKTVKESGLQFTSIKPGASTMGTPFSVQPADLEFQAGYFDFEDFLYRLEGYVEYRNADFLVSGRLFEVSKIQMTKPDTTSSGSDLQVTVSINGYQWNGTPASSGATTPTGTSAATAATSTAASTVGAP
jgi:Tfp pilus assembly protein PilO